MAGLPRRPGRVQTAGKDVPSDLKGGMTMAGRGEDRRPEAEQGDVNTTAARGRYWERNLSGEARTGFEEDRRVFLHQSLSTPVLNVIARAE